MAQCGLAWSVGHATSHLCEVHAAWPNAVEAKKFLVVLAVVD